MVTRYTNTIITLIHLLIGKIGNREPFTDHNCSLRHGLWNITASLTYYSVYQSITFLSSYLPFIFPFNPTVFSHPSLTVVVFSVSWQLLLDTGSLSLVRVFLLVLSHPHAVIYLLSCSEALLRFWFQWQEVTRPPWLAVFISWPTHLTQGILKIHWHDACTLNKILHTCSHIESVAALHGLQKISKKLLIHW